MAPDLSGTWYVLEGDLGMRVSALESRALKEAFLRALGMLQVEAVMVDYRPGTHRAQVARVKDLLEEVRRA